MSYKLVANNDVDDFPFGAFSFPVLLQACGYLFPCVSHGGQWTFVPGLDARMPKRDDYPRLISNDGFPVTDEEAKIMARMARNFVAIQRSIPSDQVDPGPDVQEIMRPWPRRIRADFVDRIEAFAEWAPGTGGFQIR